MNADERVREIIKTDNVEWSSVDGAQFQRRARRARSSRRGAAILALAGIAPVVGIVLASLSRPASHGFVGPTSGAYVDRESGYSLPEPKGWRKTIHDRNGVSFTAPDSTAEIYISLAPWLYQMASQQVPTPVRGLTRLGETASLERFKVAGHSAYSVTSDSDLFTTCSDLIERASPGASHCVQREVVVDWGTPGVLQIVFNARSRSSYDRWSGDAEGIIYGIRRIGSPPAHHGFGVLTYPSREQYELLRFLDARVDGSGAERWMNGPYSSLYRRAGRTIDHYVIDRADRVGGGGNGVEFSVSLYSAGDVQRPSWREWIIMSQAPGETMKVRNISTFGETQAVRKSPGK